MHQYYGNQKSGGLGGIIFAIYIVFGLYFVNAFVKFVQIPDAVLKYQEMIMIAGGVLLLFAGINYLRLNSNPMAHQF